MLPIPVLLIFVIIAAWWFTRSASKSVEPTSGAMVLAATPAGNIELIRKVKYVELKRIGISNPGSASLHGSTDVGLIGLFPKKGSNDILPASALTATASSELGPAYSAAQVINYTDEKARWGSKMTQQLGEWVRVELKEPTALDRIMILNRLATPGSNVVSTNMIGVQVSILDTEGKPIKTYVIAEPSLAYNFAAS